MKQAKVNAFCVITLLRGFDISKYQKQQNTPTSHSSVYQDVSTVIKDEIFGTLKYVSSWLNLKWCSKDRHYYYFFIIYGF